MAIALSVPFEKTWESLFQTLVKALKTQEADEIVLVFDNYRNNQEFFLKQQERINRLTNGRYYKSVYVRELTKCPKVKPKTNTLKTQRIKLNSFCKIHPSRPQTLKTKREMFYLILET